MNFFYTPGRSLSRQLSTPIPVPVNGAKSSTVTSTPISAKTSTAAILEGSSLLQSTPSMSNSTADTFPHSPGVKAPFTRFSSTFAAHAVTTVLLPKTTAFGLHRKFPTFHGMGLVIFRLDENSKTELPVRVREDGGERSCMVFLSLQQTGTEKEEIQSLIKNVSQVEVRGWEIFRGRSSFSFKWLRIIFPVRHWRKPLRYLLAGHSFSPPQSRHEKETVGQENRRTEISQKRTHLFPGEDHLLFFDPGHGRARWSEWKAAGRGRLYIHCSTTLVETWTRCHAKESPQASKPWKTNQFCDFTSDSICFDLIFHKLGTHHQYEITLFCFVFFFFFIHAGFRWSHLPVINHVCTKRPYEVREAIINWNN